MKNSFTRHDTSYSRKQTGHENSRNPAGTAMEVHVVDVKSWKDSYDYENVRRQRQDLFDNWEQGNKNASFTKQRNHLLK